jgi:hypothetical protein
MKMPKSEKVMVAVLLFMLVNLFYNDFTGAKDPEINRYWIYLLFYFTIYLTMTLSREIRELKKTILTLEKKIEKNPNEVSPLD